MSLDVYLKSETPITKKGTGVFIRENGRCTELSAKDVQKLYGNIIVIEDEYNTEYLYTDNITHNLGDMAVKAGIYEALWRPYRLRDGFKDIPQDDYKTEMEFENNQTIRAEEIIPYLKKGLKDLKKRPEYFKQFNAENGWGLYENFVPFVEDYLNACIENPNAVIGVSR